MSDRDRWVGVPGDSFFSSTIQDTPDLWWLTDKIKAVHEVGITGKGVIYSVNDTGGTPGHPGFTRPPLSMDSLDPRWNPKDINGHGTACSFIINQILPEADFHIWKVLGDSGGGSMSTINGAYKAAAEQGCHLISCSYGDNGGPPMRSDLDALDAGYEAGAHLIVVAAGNAGFNGSRNTIGRPASYDDHCWCVGATDRQGRISNFSSGGREMDSACYGQGMPAAHPRGGYTSFSGTSAACPYKVGILGLLIQARRSLGFADLIGPEAWKAWLIKEGLMEDMGQPGIDPSFGIGVPAVERMLDWILEKTPSHL